MLYISALLVWFTKDGALSLLSEFGIHFGDTIYLATTLVSGTVSDADEIITLFKNVSKLDLKLGSARELMSRTK